MKLLEYFIGELLNFESVVVIYNKPSKLNFLTMEPKQKKSHNKIKLCHS